MIWTIEPVSLFDPSGYHVMSVNTEISSDRIKLHYMLTRENPQAQINHFGSRRGAVRRGKECQGAVRWAKNVRVPYAGATEQWMIGSGDSCTL